MKGRPRGKKAKTRNSSQWTEVVELRKLLTTYFSYNPDTGDLIRIKDVIRNNNRPMNLELYVPVGSKTNNGYLSVTLCGHRILNHRAAFLMYHGILPPEIDHIDGNRSNNKIHNLRPSTPSLNQQNRHKKVGVDLDLPIGIYRCLRKNRPGIWYTARIQLGSIRRNTYKRNLNDAIKWRQDQEKQLFEIKTI